MAKRFAPLTVAAVTRETADAVSIAFDTGKQAAYQFLPGQYVNIRAVIDGCEVRRSYSVCTPAGGVLRVLVKQVPAGVFSTYALSHLRAGDVLDVMPPMGGFGEGIAFAAETRVCGIAAGSGISPVLSVIESVLAAGGSAALIYGNRNRDSIIFREAIAALKDRYLKRFAVYHVLSRDKTDNPLFHGRLDSERLQRLLALCAAGCQHVLMCGPVAMMDCAQAVAQTACKGARMHRELFNAPLTPTAAAAPPPAAAVGSAVVFVRIDGIRHRLCVQGDETILQAAQRARLEVPYACTGGVCGTCRAHLASGEVGMETNYVLDADELKRGFILGCQARPTSRELEVSFDV